MANTDKNYQMLKESLVENTQQYPVPFSHTPHTYICTTQLSSPIYILQLPCCMHTTSPYWSCMTHTHTFHHLDLTMIVEQYICTSALNIMCLCPISTLANLKFMEGIGSPCVCSLENLFSVVML